MARPAVRASTAGGGAAAVETTARTLFFFFFVVCGGICCRGSSAARIQPGAGRAAPPLGRDRHGAVDTPGAAEAPRCTGQPQKLEIGRGRCERQGGRVDARMRGHTCPSPTTHRAAAPAGAEKVELYFLATRLFAAPRGRHRSQLAAASAAGTVGVPPPPLSRPPGTPSFSFFVLGPLPPARFVRQRAPAVCPYRGALVFAVSAALSLSQSHRPAVAAEAPPSWTLTDRACRNGTARRVCVACPPQQTVRLSTPPAPLHQSIHTRQKILTAQGPDK